MARTPSARITVERETTFVGAGAVYGVMLDGRQVAVLRRHQTKTMDVAPAEHELYLRIRREKSSRTLHLQLAGGDEVRIRCGRPRTNAEGILRLLRYGRRGQETVIPVEVVEA